MSDTEMKPLAPEWIRALRHRLDHHPIYGALKTMEDLRVFTQQHVHSVWDFVAMREVGADADRIREAEQATIQAVEARLAFWDGVLTVLPSQAAKEDALCLS